MVLPFKLSLAVPSVLSVPTMPAMTVLGSTSVARVALPRGLLHKPRVYQWFFLNLLL